MSTRTSISIRRKWKRSRANQPQKRYEGRSHERPFALLSRVSSPNAGRVSCSVFRTRKQGSAGRAVGPVSSFDSGECVPERARILIVEDNIDVLTVLSTIVEQLGYEVLGASSFQEFKIIYAGHRRDLHAVVSDFHLQDGSAIDVARALAISDVKIPLVIMTGSIEAEVTACIPPYAVILNKPFSGSELKGALAKAQAIRD